jgi:hypothetical protein
MANLKTHALLDALEFGSGDWEVSIQYLKNRLANKPEDLAVRDALNYLIGYHNGYLGCKNVGDNHYKYGVRKWLEGDYDTAARAFARTVRENPDDIAAYRSYAYTLGLRAGSDRYKSAGGTYPIINIPEKKVSDQQVTDKLKELRLAASVDPQNLKLRAMLSYYEGMAVHYNYYDPSQSRESKTLDAKAQNLFDEGLNKLTAHDYEGAFRAFTEVGRDSLDDKVLLFSKWYAAGRAGAERDDGSSIPWDPRMNEVFNEFVKESLEEDLFLLFQPEPIETATETLNEQLKDTNKRNPFFGLLSDEQIQRLKEWTFFK